VNNHRIEIPRHGQEFSATPKLPWCIEWRAIGLALVVAWLGVMPIMAEESTERGVPYSPVLHVGGRLGYIKLSKVDDDGSFNIGLTGGAFFLSRLALEASVDYQETDILAYVFDDPDLSFEIERETTALQAGLILMPFPEHRVRPYATGGLGYYYSRYTSEYSPSDEVGEGGYYAGFGLEISAFSWDDEVSIMLETRWLFTEKEEYATAEIHADGFCVMLGVRGKFP
jgi:hypothetical protein